MSYTLVQWNDDQILVAQMINRKFYAEASDFLHICFINADGVQLQSKLSGMLFVLEIIKPKPKMAGGCSTGS